MKPDSASLLWSCIASLPREERPDAFRELLDAVDGIYAKSGKPSPAWAAEARTRLRNGDAGMIGGPNPPRDG